MHEGPRHVLFATDPLLDATVAWDVVKKCDQGAIDAFLGRIRAMGFSPEVVITDGSALYKESLVARWADVEHQLCIFHVLANINKDVLKAARGLRDALPKPKRYRRGRPCKRGRPRKRDDRRKFVTEHLYLIVKRRDRFTPDDLADWRRMVGIDPAFAVLKRFVDEVHGLFEKGITKRAAREAQPPGEERGLHGDSASQARDPQGRARQVREDDRVSGIREPRPDEQPRRAGEQVVPDAAEDAIPEEEDADDHAGAAAPRAPGLARASASRRRKGDAQKAQTQASTGPNQQREGGVMLTSGEQCPPAAGKTKSLG